MCVLVINAITIDFDGTSANTLPIYTNTFQYVLKDFDNNGPIFIGASYEE